MPRKLKVFRTSIGFHDAYVAASSRKAALEAWGADADLFARGVAEEVTDPKLMAEPLERPGEVIRVSRGDLAAQLKTLGPRKSKAKKAGRKERSPARPAPTKLARPKPPPKRDRVEAAESALADARSRHETETKDLEARRDAIDRQLKALRAKQAKERAPRTEARRGARGLPRSARPLERIAEPAVPRPVARISRNRRRRRTPAEVHGPAGRRPGCPTGRQRAREQRPAGRRRER